ncbi:hypothetical protein ACTWQB_15175 [Piscibacillus sp. B03]|uniref:hypothetical protein n=1 Tax=Piscibacillus sp. B03 TaxID=3457430 RepID=UPI003FCD18CB
MEKYDLRIRIDFEVNSLYDLAYLSVDIYQLIVFCELLEDDKVEDELKIFLDNLNSLHRYSKSLIRFREKVKIVHLKDGSMEIFVGEVTELTKLILPFISAYVVNKIRLNKEKVTFEIESDDYELNLLFDELKQGYYGLEEEKWFDWLQDILKSRGYSVEVVNKDCYKVIKGYGRRIVKTIPKNIKPHSDE